MELIDLSFPIPAFSVVSFQACVPPLVKHKVLYFSRTDDHKLCSTHYTHVQILNGVYVCVCVVCKVNTGYRVYSTAGIQLMSCFSSHICLRASVVVLQPTILSCACCLRPSYSVWISALLLIASYAKMENRRWPYVAFF